MPLIPLSLARHLAPGLKPLRALAERAWLREAEVDFFLSRVHPLLRLNRVFARLEARHWVADDMLALTFRVNGNARRWRPGQHVQLHQTVDGVRLGRSYSLTAVHADGRVELAIKRQPGGRLSNRLLDFLEVGTRVEMGQAEGELRWPQGADGVLLLAAGSGLTPLLGLLREALAQGFAAPVTLLHYVRRRGQRAFAEELQALARRHPNFSVRWAISGEPPAADELAGRFLPDHVQHIDASDLLACGPHGFVSRVRPWWQAEPRRGALQLEAFSAPALNPDEPARQVRLGFARSRSEMQGDSRYNLLEQAEAHGLRPAHGCRQGVCTRCTCKLVSGTVRDVRTGALSAEPGQPIRLCVSAPMGDLVLDL
ncbi:ferredoxin reductase [Pseudomonas tohonis]|uniref:ferredoxin reductase n=1 Tax=Pseudomonas tohonis TaxID=2725477 RepID=UPI0022F0A1AC|nr:ferredoxin reductase [Pseudomonas tohonis]